MPRSIDEDKAIVEAGFEDKVRKTLGKVPFSTEAAAAWYAARDPATPVRVKAILLGALAYFVLPIDAVPDIIAGLGFTDDAAILFGAYRSLADHITGAHRARARAYLDQAGDRA